MLALMGDTPHPDELRSKFSFETKVMPPPDAGDFRVVLGDEEKERVKRMVVRMVDSNPRGEILVKGAPRSRL